MATMPNEYTPDYCKASKSIAYFSYMISGFGIVCIVVMTIYGIGAPTVGGHSTGTEFTLIPIPGYFVYFIKSLFIAIPLWAIGFLCSGFGYFFMDKNTISATAFLLHSLVIAAVMLMVLCLLSPFSK